MPITAGGDDRDNDAAVSPIGDSVAFTRAGRGSGRSGSEARTRNAADEADGDMDPSWSPDGSRITFNRQDEMWVMDADGGDVRRISEPGDVGTAAAWSPR